MKEPTRYSMSTGEPVKEDTHKIPMPSIYAEGMRNDLFKKEDLDENTKESNQT